MLNSHFSKSFSVFLITQTSPMELQTSTKAKQLWNLLRVAFFMMRNGLLSKRKLVGMEMNLILKRGKLLIGKNLGNLVAFHHHHHSKSKQQQQLPPAFPTPFAPEEYYEFSCENSPSPAAFHLGAKSFRSYFPCIGAPAAEAAGEEEEGAEETLKRAALMLEAENSPQCSNSSATPRALLASGEKRRHLLLSPYAVRVSNYSMEDWVDDGVGKEVDSKAEEFIKRFYEELQAQSQFQEDQRS